jgi:transposase
MWFAGIEWADTHHDTLVIDESGQQVGSLRVLHTKQGIDELKHFLLDIAEKPDQLACLVETSHGLLITALLEAGFTVYPKSPKSIDRRRNAAGVKTDALDAYVLAKTGRSDLADLRKLQPDTPVVAELKLLTRDQDGLIQSQTRLVNQLTACLKTYYPVALTLFSKLHQRSTLAFLQTYPTPEAAMAAQAWEIELLLRNEHHPQPQRHAQQLVELLHQPQLEADAVTTRAKSPLMLALVSQRVPLVQQIAQYDKDIAALFLSHEDNEVFRSLPRAGKRLAPRRFPEIGEDRTRYADAASPAALAGTAPVAFQSGNYAKAHKRYAWLKPLRNALYQCAWQSTLEEPWALDYSRRKRAEGKSHTMAVRALANVWVRIIYAMWLKHTCYERATFEAAQRHHASLAA